MLRSVSLEVVPCFVRIFAMTTEETTYQLKPAACGKKGSGGIFTRNESIQHKCGEKNPYKPPEGGSHVLVFKYSTHLKQTFFFLLTPPNVFFLQHKRVDRCRTKR